MSYITDEVCMISDRNASLMMDVAVLLQVFGVS